MPKEYIERETAIKEMSHMMHECFPEADEELDAVITTLKEIPAADVVEVVRCGECKHRIVNEHFGEKGYMKLKARCELDTGDPFELGRNAEDDDWFCADGERVNGGQDDGT